MSEMRICRSVRGLINKSVKRNEYNHDIENNVRFSREVFHLMVELLTPISCME